MWFENLFLPQRLEKAKRKNRKKKNTHIFLFGGWPPIQCKSRITVKKLRRESWNHRHVLTPYEHCNFLSLRSRNCSEPSHFRAVSKSSIVVADSDFGVSPENWRIRVRRTHANCYWSFQKFIGLNYSKLPYSTTFFPITIVICVLLLLPGQVLSHFTFFINLYKHIQDNQSRMFSFAC